MTISFPLRQTALAAALCALAAPAAAQPVSELAPITVTASKQDQALRDINGAAVVVPADALRAAQVDGTMQLSRVLPGVQLSSSGSFLFPIVSVRGVTSAQDFYNPALTVYVDGVPQLPTFTSQLLTDVDRVELLKGPQGTLYGKSAMGGVLNIVSRQPGDEPYFRASAGVASRDGYLFKATGGGPLVENLLYGSVTAAVNDAPGRLDNPVTGADGVGGTSATAGAARLRLAPAGSPWELGLAVSGECTRASQDAYVPFDDIHSTQAYIAPGMPASLADFYQKRCGGSQSLTGQYDFDGWRLNAVAAWQNLHYDRHYPIGPYYSYQPERWRQQVQELRLSTTGKRRVDGVLGLYRQRVTQSRTYINQLQAPMQIDALNTESDNTSESIAAYADATWHVTEAFDLSAGLRYSRDKASTRYDGTALNFATFGQDAFGGADSTSGSSVLGKLSAGYRLSPEWRVYASAAQGYKPGGYNLAPSSPADAQPYGKEKGVSYEAGARYDGDTLRLSTSVYRIDVRDAQLYVSDQVGYQHLENVGKTRSTGVEFEASWDVTPQWTVGLDGFIDRAEFRGFNSDAVCAGCAGNRVPFSPSYGLTAKAQGNFDTGIGRLSPALAVRRIGSQFFDIGNDLRQEAYTLIDLSVAWRIRPQVEATLYANNLTDKRYRTYGFSGGPLGNFAQVDAGRTVGLNVAFEY
ncbi:MAG: TonB-dependent siderophore receptor [Achromobacter sp.]|uniref:TonB-dependent receptor n=1 Tax=Achromobacter sp. TaxID=134375 RepID=UPI00258F9B03|nr:TonB-dependent siderophore receptor [Achromobacter sp.]MCW0206593.1 TonB-dependent siderophore receptor [Achromobacter sp.]